VVRRPPVLLENRVRSDPSHADVAQEGLRRGAHGLHGRNARHRDLAGDRQHASLPRVLDHRRRGARGTGLDRARFQSGRQHRLRAADRRHRLPRAEDAGHRAAQVRRHPIRHHEEGHRSRGARADAGEGRQRMHRASPRVQGAAARHTLLACRRRRRVHVWHLLRRPLLGVLRRVSDRREAPGRWHGDGGDCKTRLNGARGWFQPSVPRQCDPGNGKRVVGSECLVGDDCTSGVCEGAVWSAQTTDPDTTKVECPVPFPYTDAKCNVSSVRGGRCR
jgi:hypothetical protein